MRPSLLSLAEHFAELYPWESDIRRVVQEAGMPEHLVKFQGSAAAIWADVTNLAERAPGLTQRLLAVARKEYGDNTRLLTLIAAYEKAREDRPMEYSVSPPGSSGRVDRMQTDVVALQTQMARLETQLENLQDTIDDLKTQMRWYIGVIALLAVVVVLQLSWIL